MKKYYVLFIFLFCFGCCLSEIDESIWIVDLPKEVFSFKTACYYGENKITYREDYYDRWKYPNETLKEGCGDCEDICILLIAFIYMLEDYQCNLVIIEKTNLVQHAVIKYRDGLYEYGGSKVDYDYKILLDIPMNQLEYIIPLKRY